VAGPALKEVAVFRPEILAPAGNFFKLETAIRYGADAVYLAGKRFGLRSAAENFTDSEIRAACRLAAAHGVRIYAVLNSFLFDRELADLPPFVTTLIDAGVDAAIVSDLGVLEVVREQGLPIHLSTQASALSIPAARFWKARGVKRLVLGREVGIEQAGRIKREAGIEVELFVHGAMCSAFSGNCTISNYTAGRDSNRGGCIQSCRFRYRLGDHSGHFLSSKDLRGIDLLDQFSAHEIDSLKIEGRMKGPRYTANTVRAYRLGLEAIARGDRERLPELRAELETMSHRDYTTANLIGKAGPGSIYDHPDSEARGGHAMVGHVLEAHDRFLAIFVKNPLVAGEPIALMGTDGRDRILDTSAMRDLSGQPIARATPNSTILLAPVANAEPGLLLRKVHDAANRRDTARSA